MISKSEWTILGQIICFWFFWQASKEETQKIQGPKPYWQDDVVLATYTYAYTYTYTHVIWIPGALWEMCWIFHTQRNGHKEDILCIAQCTPHHLATGSYDGEIIVWNVVSERILCRFKTPQPTPQQSSSYPSMPIFPWIFNELWSQICWS